MNVDYVIEYSYCSYLISNYSYLVSIVPSPLLFLPNL